MNDEPPPIDPNDRWDAPEPVKSSEPPPFKTDAALVSNYRFADGSLAFKICRWEAKNGADSKKIRPACWDGKSWVWKNIIPAGERPLLNLPEIINSPEANILVVEGEKKARAAEKYLPENWVVTCWANGSQGLKATDLSPLEGRHVVMWPDNDQAGMAAARDLVALYPAVRVVDIPLSFPDGWDLADHLPEGYDADWVMAQITSLWASIPDPPDDTVPATSPLTTDPLNWSDTDIPPRRWLVKDLLPFHVPTMLSGMGGLGKSLLGMQLAHAAALGTKWIGKPLSSPVKAFCVFSEDDQAELHRRFHAINDNLGNSFGDLENLRLMIREGEQSSLMDFPNPYEPGKESSFFQLLLDEIKAFGAQFILLDSLYNFFHGNENNRVQVTQFVYLLRRLAKECDAALVFIAHPSKSGISTGEGYAGSTAWHDAVRARLYLAEEKDDEDGEKRLVLNTMKANYAPREGKTEIFYHKGMMWPKGTDDPGTPAHFSEQAQVVFLKCLRECQTQGKNLSHSKNSGSYAPKTFSRMGTASGFRVADLAKAMDELFAAGKIKTGPYFTPNRKKRDGLFEVVTTKDDPELELSDD